jgi:hypothetical protein
MMYNSNKLNLSNKFQILLLDIINISDSYLIILKERFYKKRRIVTYIFDNR